MSELSCNIVLYHPDPEYLAERFRTWHVEALLNQAETLIDRALQDFNSYSSLDYAWNKFQLEVKTEEKQLQADGHGVTSLAPARETIPEPVEAAVEASAQGADESDAEAGSGAPGEVEREAAPPPPAAEAVNVPKTTLQVRAEAVQRKRELSAPGQPFALDEQRDLALKRLCRDYEQALNRACVAEQGLRSFYGRTDFASPLPTEAESLAASITKLANWIRNSIGWLVAYQQQEQEFTRVVSVRSLLGRNTWAVLKHSRDNYAIKVQIPADLFRGYDNCLIRGVGASLMGEAGTVPWSVTVRLPEEAVYERSGESVNVDQTGRPPCLLGCVENRRSARPVEMCGTVSLLNASPIGRETPGGFWSVDMVKPGAISESFNHVEDLILEIHVGGMPQKAKS